MSVNNARKTPGKPFPVGNSGRPKGSRNRRTLLAEKIMHEDLEEVARAVTAAAKQGDMQAARIVMDRLAPVRRGRPVVFDLPSGRDAAGLADGFDALLQAVAGGELTPEEGAAVANLLEARRKTIETMEIEARIAALESRADEKGKRR
jgi:hypothetical protein